MQDTYKLKDRRRRLRISIRLEEHRMKEVVNNPCRNPALWEKAAERRDRFQAALEAASPDCQALRRNKEF